MRIAVVGDTLSSRMFSALLVGQRSDARIDIWKSLVDSKGSGQQNSFSRAWIRNDPIGRYFVMSFCRDLLGMPEQEILVSDVKAAGKISLLEWSQKKTSSSIPSFRSVVGNLPVAFSDITSRFRRRSVDTVNMSLDEFLTFQFGHRFAKRYANVVCAGSVGACDPSTVPAMCVIPKIIETCAKHNCGVMLGPLAQLLSSGRTSTTNSFASNWSTHQHTNVLDHLWQRVMSGGKYLNLADWSVFEKDLHGKLQDSGVVHWTRDTPVHMERLKNGKVSLATRGKEYDMVVFGESGESLWSLCGTTESAPAWVRDLSRETRSVMTTRVRIGGIDASNVRRNTAGSVWNAGVAEGSSISPIIGAVIPAILFPNPIDDSNELLVHVFHIDHCPPDPIVHFVTNAFGTSLSVEVADERPTEETLLAPPSLSWTSSLTEMNKWRLSRFGSSLQVLGPQYYASDSSVMELFRDAKELADLVDARNGAKENEQTPDWTHRCGKSLDGKYSFRKDVRLRDVWG